MQPKTAAISTLTSLRFFAASFIVFNHTYTLGLFPFEPLYFPILAQGVSFFFILSGFILALNYTNFSQPGSLQRYFVARVARIYPLYIFVLIFAVLIRYLSSPQSFVDPLKPLFAFIEEASLLQAWFAGQWSFLPFNPPGWTISAEALFYVVFPLFIVPRTRGWALVATAISITAYLAYAHFSGVPMAFEGYTLIHMITENPLARLPEFVLGILLCKGFMAVAPKPSDSTTGQGSLWTLMEVGAVLACYLLSWLSRYLSSYPAPRAVIGDVAAAVIFGSGAAPGFAALIFIFAFQRGALSRLLKNGSYVLLGELSFSLYLVHLPLIWYRPFIVPFFAAYGQLTAVQQVATYGALGLVLVGISLALHLGIEVPFRAVIRRLAQPRTVRSCPVASV